MFYEENSIKKLLKCHQCQDSFDRPLSTPCGYVICSICMNRGVIKNTDQFACSICSETHKLSVNGFPDNQIVLSLLKEQPKEVCKYKEIEELKVNLKKDQERFDMLESKIDHSDYKVTNHFNEQRNLVNLKTEESIKEVRNASSSLIKTIDECEKDCLFKLRTLSVRSEMKFESVIRPEFIRNHNEANSYLQKGILNENDIDEANKIVARSKKFLELESENLDRLLFGKKMLEFTASKTHLNETIIGVLNAKELNEQNKKSKLFSKILTLSNNNNNNNNNNQTRNIETINKDQQHFSTTMRNNKFYQSFHKKLTRLNSKSSLGDSNCDTLSDNQIAVNGALVRNKKKNLRPVSYPTSTSHTNSTDISNINETS